MRQSVTQRGFTLIEVLVALAIMAMIATILITSLQLGGHTWQRVTRTTSQTDEIAQAQDFLRRRLSMLYPYASSPTKAQRPAFLVADDGIIEFTSDAPDALATGMMRYRVTVERTTGNLEIRSRTDVGVNLDAVGPWTTEPLLSHVASLTVQFWLAADESPGRWVDRWTDLTHVPRLIRIDVAFSASDSRQWPTLYLEPRVTTPVSCEFDVVSRQCRSGA